jgi:hypothetical protein
MGDGERSGSGRRNDWPVLIGGMLGCGAFGAVALFVVKPLVELPLWLGTIAFCTMIVVGTVLGQFIGRRLFRPPSGDPPVTPEDQPRRPDQPS